MVIRILFEYALWHSNLKVENPPFIMVYIQTWYILCFLTSSYQRVRKLMGLILSIAQVIALVQVRRSDRLKALSRIAGQEASHGLDKAGICHKAWLFSCWLGVTLDRLASILCCKGKSEGLLDVKFHEVISFS